MLPYQFPAFATCHLPIRQDFVALVGQLRPQHRQSKSTHNTAGLFFLPKAHSLLYVFIFGDDAVIVSIPEFTVVVRHRRIFVARFAF